MPTQAWGSIRLTPAPRGAAHLAGRPFAVPAAAVALVVLIGMLAPAVASAGYSFGEPMQLSLSPAADARQAPTIGALYAGEKRYRAGRRSPTYNLGGDEGRYDRANTGYWNTYFEYAHGAVELIVRFADFELRELEGDSYLQNADVVGGSATVRLGGALSPGVRLWAEGGASTIQIRPEGDSGYDPFDIGYLIGFGTDIGIDLPPVGMVIFSGGIFLQENSSDDDSNSKVVSAGSEVTYHAYTFRASVIFLLEIVGYRDGLRLNVYGGVGYHYLIGDMLNGSADLTFYYGATQEVFGRFGLSLGVGRSLSVEIDVRVSDRNLVMGTASVALIFD